MMKATTKKGVGARTLGRMAAGAVVGGGTTILFFELFGKRNLDLGSPEAVLAVSVGLIYALIGMIVGVGSVLPGVGARFLNVEDAAELREQRKLFGESSIGCILVGLMLLVLAAADGEGVVSREVAAVVSGVCLAATFVLSLRTSSQSDELMRRISVESSALALYAALLLFGGWGALAHLEYVPWIGPLAWISALALIELLAIFWVSGKKGLLEER